MGKLGDLWVRLGLKSDDYKKGIDKAKKETKGFGSTLANMKAGALAVWAAIGAGVIKVAKDIVNASNNMGDMMAVKARQVEAVWQTVLTSISAGFSNLLARAESSARAAKALQEMEDAEFEMLNSVSLQRAEMEAELVKLEIESRDATKSYEQRAAAAEKYLTMVEKLYRIEMNYYQDLARQSAATWLDSASTPKGAILGSSEGNVAALHRFLKEYGEDNALQKAVANYRKAWKEAGELWDRTQSGKEALRWVNENRQDWGQTNYRRFALDLGYSYEEQKNDELNGTKLVDNIKKAYDAAARYDRETKKMQNNLNSLSAQIGNIDLSGSVDIDLSKVTSAHEIAFKTGQQIAKDLRTLEAEFSEIEDLDIDMSDIENEMNAFLESWKYDVEKVAEMNRMLNDAVVSGITNGIQAITDAMFQIEGADWKSVLAAFIAPLGDTMKQMGAMIMAEGVAMSAFKKSFTNPAAAIAAGAALIAVGSIVSSGLQRLISGAGNGGGSAMSYGSSSGGAAALNYESTLTVEVIGRISGNDIVLSGKKTNDKNSR